MMRNLRYIYMSLVLTMAAACSDNAPDESAMSGNIQLGASVGNLQIDSRATADAWDDEESLKADVWFRAGDGSYEDAGTTNWPVHTTVVFKSSENWQTDVTHGDQVLKYPVPVDNSNDDSKVLWCIGMYPASDASKNWRTDNGHVSHEIDGSTDLMFAPEISGSWNNHFPTQEYEHLLTWIKITVLASSHEAAETWGKIEQITVNSDSEVSINLNTGAYTYTGGTKEIETMAADNAYTLTAKNVEIGSVFCSPKTEYTVTIKVEGKEPKTVTFNDLKVMDVEDIDGDGNTEEEIAVTGDNVDSLRGACLVISLYFTHDANVNENEKVIEGVCTLNSWCYQSEDIDIEPKQ